MSLYQDIKKHQKGVEGSSGYLMAWTYRKVSIFFSMLFIKLRFSPNFITFLSMVSDFVVIYLMYLGHWIWAGILVNLAVTLDCCDGEVARYYNDQKKKKGEKVERKYYGGYLDEVLGIIGFTLVVFFAGYFIEGWQLGFFAVFGLFLLLITSLTSTVEFPQKKEIAKKFEEGLFGKLKGRIGFSCPMQRMLISLAVIFSSKFLLVLFGVIAYMMVLLKFWLYRKY